MLYYGHFSVVSILVVSRSLNSLLGTSIVRIVSESSRSEALELIVEAPVLFGRVPVHQKRGILLVRRRSRIMEKLGSVAVREVMAADL